jgi:hypothetical protein
LQFSIGPLNSATQPTPKDISNFLCNKKCWAHKHHVNEVSLAFMFEPLKQVAHISSFGRKFDACLSLSGDLVHIDTGDPDIFLILFLKF